MKWRRILILVMVLAVCNCMAAAEDNAQQASWRLKRQEKKLQNIEEEALWRREDIERRYAKGMNEVRELAEVYAERLTRDDRVRFPSHKRVRLTSDTRVAWTEFINLNNQEPSSGAPGSGTEFLHIRQLWGRERDVRRLRLAMREDYILRATVRFLLDEDAVELLRGIVARRSPDSVIYRKARKILDIMEMLERRRMQIEAERRDYLAELEQWERDSRTRVYRRQPAKAELGVVSAICHEPSQAFVMIEGIDENIVYEGDQVSDIRVIKIQKDSVEFEKNRQRWVQKIGETPDKRWQ